MTSKLSTSMTFTWSKCSRGHRHIQSLPSAKWRLNQDLIPLPPHQSGVAMPSWCDIDDDSASVVCQLRPTCLKMSWRNQFHTVKSHILVPLTLCSHTVSCVLVKNQFVLMMSQYSDCHQMWFYVACQSMVNPVRILPCQNLLLRGLIIISFTPKLGAMSLIAIPTVRFPIAHWCSSNVRPAPHNASLQILQRISSSGRLMNCWTLESDALLKLVYTYLAGDKREKGFPQDTPKLETEMRAYLLA